MVKKTKRQSSTVIYKQAEALIPTPWGDFNMIAFSENEEDWMPHLALVHKDVDTSKAVLVRVHSECITGDLFGSKRCDCGEQLAKALELAAEKGGIVLYLRQEGRGIGIINKLKAYQLQDKGLNTVDANLHLGLEVDARQYDIAVQMLEALGIHQIHLLTNNPEKIEAFDTSSVKVLSRVPLIIKPQEENFNYLKTKQDEMGHLFKL
jgi:3,4-dihydroxy 2-butanone 4-phosphate synthase/GTP cyclohydrolase II